MILDLPVKMHGVVMANASMLDALQELGVMGVIPMSFLHNGIETPGYWLPVIVNHTLKRTQFVMARPDGEVIRPTPECSCSSDDWPQDERDKHDVEFIRRDQ